jgi:hypothetical protein
MSEAKELNAFHERVQRLSALSEIEKQEIIQLASQGKLTEIVRYASGFPSDNQGNSNLATCLKFRVAQHNSK